MLPSLKTKRRNKMNKMFNAFLIFALALCVSTPAFAMAKKPDPNTYAGCMQRPTTECSQYGNPWDPNFPCYIASQSNLTGYVCLKDSNGNDIPNPKYDPKKKTYDPVAYFKCAEPIYAQCKAQFGK